MTAALLFLGAAGAIAVVRLRSSRQRRVPLRRLAGAPDRRSSLPPPPAWFAASVSAAMPGTDATKWWGGWLAACSVAGWLAFSGALGGALVVGAAAALAPVAGRAAGHRRDHRAFDAALPDALDAVARSLRTGASLPAALAEAAASPASGPVADDLGVAASAADAGVPIREALAALVDRRPVVPVRLAVAALSLAADAGGAPSQAVEQVAATLRDRAALAREVRALASQARASALVIAVAPVGFTVLAGAADRTILAFLLGSTAGGACLVVGLALDGVAAWWMARITRAAW